VIRGGGRTSGIALLQRIQHWRELIAEMFASLALQHGQEKQGISWAVASVHLTEEPLAFLVIMHLAFKSLWFENRSKESNGLLHVIQCYSAKKKKISINLIKCEKHKAFTLTLSMKCKIYGKFLLATVRKIAFPQEEYGNILVCLKN